MKGGELMKFFLMDLSLNPPSKINITTNYHDNNQYSSIPSDHNGPPMLDSTNTSL